jgi:hypothetical protein
MMLVWTTLIPVYRARPGDMVSDAGGLSLVE